MRPATVAALAVVAMAVVLAPARAATDGPCDWYDAGGTPCVAAHSTTRSLYQLFFGPLYQVQRSSDKATKDIGVIAPGGPADSAAQDAFCGTDTCRVITIYDQSSQGNHITLAPPGGAAPHADIGVNATRNKISMGGRSVYGAYFEGGMGYRRENTTGVATGDEPESLYMVVDGNHYNGRCCFDYGNAETDAHDHGAGTMEAVYFGNSSGWGHGGAHGPWIMADLENGLWAGNSKVAPSDTPIIADYVTAMVKGNSGNQFALLGGDATKGELTKLYEGPRPPSYHPMKKQGAIILGIGGDNSDWAVGTFYEGAMTKGYASDATTANVQASIVAAGYGQ